MNKIKNYKIETILYNKAEIIFDSLDSKKMPSMLTGNGPNDISGESIIGCNPFRYKKLVDGKTLWKDLRVLNNSTTFHEKEYPLNKIGGIGFLSYEALHTIEKIDKKTIDHISMPLAEWIIYSTYFYFDNHKKRAWKIDIEYNGKPDNIQEMEYSEDYFRVTDLNADFTENEYINNAAQIIENIEAGEVYEVNLTQGISGNFKGSPYTLFKQLYKRNSAPYSAYLQRDDYTVICNSPEMFLKVENHLVETRPIKGTTARGSNTKEDQLLKDELYNSEKNQAELYMIIDLMRNDLSKVCKTGSVEVITPKRVESYENVHHLIGIIRGELSDNKDIIDLLIAAFPGGSITGCPKVRCMQLTEDLEKSSRNLYTGSIFIMNKNYLNSNIVIRSAIIQNDKIVLNSGGAVTIDSDPQDEFKESRIKLSSLFKVLNYEDDI